MPWGNEKGPAGRGPTSGRGRGFCRGTAEPGILAQALGNLVVGLLAWGGRALSRRASAGLALPNSEPPPSLEVVPNQIAVGASTREAALAELQEQARSLEQQLDVMRQRIRRLESQGSP
jgi:hypothetical protein